MKSRSAIYSLQVLIAVLIFAIQHLAIAETSTDTQVSQANNITPQSCGVNLDLPDFLPRNIDDDQATTHVDYEKWDLSHSPSEGEFGDLKILTFTGNAGKTDGTMTLQILSGSTKINGKFWLEEEKITEIKDPKDLKWSVPSETSHTVTLYVEGYEPSDSDPDIKIKASIACPAGVGKDGKNYSAGYAEIEKETAVYEVDLDVDSNNDNGFSPEGYIDEEDRIEFSAKPERLGKIIQKNESDKDKDGVYDSLENLGLTEVGGNGSNSVSNNLIPVKVRLSNAFDPKKATVKFDYNSSIPRAGEGVSATSPYEITKRGLRLWTANGSSRESGKDVDDEGQFVPAGRELKWSDLAGENVREVKWSP